MTSIRRWPSDDQVAALPLGSARADLMEEIMATPTSVPERADAPVERPQRPRWGVVLAAAAAIAVVIATPVWLGSRGDDGAPTTSPAPSAVSSAPDLSGPPRPYAVLTAPGWTVEDVYGPADDGEIEYANGDQSLQINWRPADEYAGYVEDRADIGAAAAVDLVGEPSRMWTYGADDRTTIRPAYGETFLEVRGEGMGRAAYLALLEAVRGTDAAGFGASLPGGAVVSGDVDAVVAELLTGVTVPDGFDAGAIEVPSFSDRYDAGAAVTSTVGCAWLAQYQAARTSGDTPAEHQAAVAMGGSRAWPILQEMQDQGGWSDVFWQIADGMGAGEPLPEAEQGIGC